MGKKRKSNYGKPDSQISLDDLLDIEVPLPDEEEKKKWVWNIGANTYEFDTRKEAMIFFKLIFVDKVLIEDALKHMKKLKNEGFFEEGEEEDDGSPFDGGY